MWDKPCWRLCPGGVDSSVCQEAGVEPGSRIMRRKPYNQRRLVKIAMRCSAECS